MQRLLSVRIILILISRGHQRLPFAQESVFFPYTSEGLGDKQCATFGVRVTHPEADKQVVLCA